MLLKDRQGIACDFCSTRYKEKFVYYSIKATEFKVANNMRLPGTNPKFSKDMCVMCHGTLLEEIMKFIGQFKRGHIKDDLSKKYANGSFVYWIVLFDKVEVDKALEGDDQIKVERKVLDLNLVDYKKFADRTKKAEEQLKKTGDWA